MQGMRTTHTSLMILGLFGSAASSAYAVGSVLAWGDNGQGQCNVPSPSSGFSAIGGGKYHSLALRGDGTIAVWGGNDYGQLNLPPPNANFVKIAPGYFHSLAIRSDGAVAAWGFNETGACNVPAPNSGFLAVAGGGYHSVGLKAGGVIVTWGANQYGQGNVSAPNSGFTAIAAGLWHTLGLRSDGSVAAWGLDDQGQCNVPAPNANFIAIAAGSAHSLGLKSDGSIVAWGDNSQGQLNVLAPNSSYTAVSAGDGHSLGLRSNGSIAAWGRNAEGQLNIPSPNSGFSAISAGFTHSVALQAPDLDADGVPDSSDNCPTVANTNQQDTDSDGYGDACDGCPNDSNKTMPGVCGCGVSDADSDGDGTPDCNDGCPADPSKTAPGQCGCGTADTDTDGDGVADCHDVCPGDNDALDCNSSGLPDCLEVASGTSADCNTNHVPDECEAGRWIGADGASFLGPDNWSPTGVPTIDAVLLNTSNLDNRCVLAPWGTELCGLTLGATGSGRQILQIGLGRELYASSRLTVEPGGVLEALTASRVIVSGDRVRQAGQITIHSLAAVAFYSVLMNSSGGSITLLNGSLASAGLTNAGGASIRGAGTIDSSVTNNGEVNVIADLLVAGNLSNSGTVTIQSGILTVTGSLSGSGTIIGGFGGRDGNDAGLLVRGDCDIAATDSRQIDLTSAIVQMDGDPADEPQTLEVLAADVGSRGVKMPDPALFSIGTLRIGPTPTTVQLVDRHRNSPGADRRLAGARREALYVDRLILDPGITLDLAGLHLYYGGATPADPFAADSGVRAIDTVGGGALARVSLSAERRFLPTARH